MILIGIDPDVDKSGFAVWSTEAKQFISADKFCFWDLIYKIREFKPDKVYLEAGWLNKKSNYHSVGGKHSERVKKLIGERIANKVGRNHQVGINIEEWLKVEKIDYELIIPKKSKVKPEQFKIYTGLTTKNQEIIDACMLIFGRTK